MLSQLSKNKLLSICIDTFEKVPLGEESNILTIKNASIMLSLNYSSNEKGEWKVYGLIACNRSGDFSDRLEVEGHICAQEKIAIENLSQDIPQNYIKSRLSYSSMPMFHSPDYKREALRLNLMSEIALGARILCNVFDVINVGAFNIESETYKLINEHFGGVPLPASIESQDLGKNFRNVDRALGISGSNTTYVKN